MVFWVVLPVEGLLVVEGAVVVVEGLVLVEGTLMVVVLVVVVPNGLVAALVEWARLGDGQGSSQGASTARWGGCGVAGIGLWTTVRKCG